MADRSPLAGSRPLVRLLRPFAPGGVSAVGALRRVVAWGQWVVVPLVVAAGIKARTADWKVATEQPPEVTVWQQWAMAVDRIPHVDFVFVGSSRVAAAVDLPAFGTELHARTGKQVTALNLGLGYSTAAEQYLCLRNLIRKSPEKFRGAIVLIESPGGVPTDTSDWEERWYHPDRPGILTGVLRERDLVKLWWSRRTSPEESAQMTFEFAVRKSPVLVNRDRVGREFVARGSKRVREALVPPPPPAPPPPPSTGADLAAAGGIRTDDAGVQLAKQIAFAQAQEELRDQKPRRIDDRMIVADIVRLVHGAGGRVVFFHMPLHPIQQQTHETPLRLAERDTFQVIAEKWDTPIVRPDLATNEDDFPDAWHMRRSLAPAFSQKLAAAFLLTGRPFAPR